MCYNQKEIKIRIIIIMIFTKLLFILIIIMCYNQKEIKIRIIINYFEIVNIFFFYYLLKYYFYLCIKCSTVSQKF